MISARWDDDRAIACSGWNDGSSTSSTVAPSGERPAASRTAASTSSSTGQPPGRTHSANRIPSTPSNVAGSRLRRQRGDIHRVRARDHVLEQRQSATVRASGPLWQ